MAEGHSEDSFWRQTFATFGAAMRARRRLAHIRMQEAFAVAHVSAEMTALAGIGKLPPLDEYLRRLEPPRKRTARDMIVVLEDAAARGAQIRIRKREG